MPKNRKPYPSAAAGKGIFGWIVYLVSNVAIAGPKACCSLCKKVLSPGEVSSHYSQVHKLKLHGRDWFCKSCCMWTTRDHICEVSGDCLYFGREDIMGFYGPVTDEIHANVETIRKSVPVDRKNCFRLNRYWVHHNGPCDSCLGRNPDLSSAIDKLGSIVLTDAFGFIIHPLMRLKQSTICSICKAPETCASKLVIRVDNFCKYGFEEKVAVPDVACLRKDEGKRQFPALSAEDEERLIALFNGEGVPTVITREEYKGLCPEAQEFYDLKGKTAILDAF